MIDYLSELNSFLNKKKKKKKKIQLKIFALYIKTMLR